MIITPYITYSYISYRIRANEKSPEIIVSKSRKLIDAEWGEPQINWPGCGDMNLSQTHLFIGALEAAKLIAFNLQDGAVPEKTIDGIKNLFQNDIIY